MKFIITLYFLLFSILVQASLPQVNFSTSLKNVMEGDMVTVTAELSQTSSDLVMIPFHVTGSADSNDSNLQDGVLYISPNQTKGSITFQVFHDDENEQTDTIILSMLAPTNAVLGTTKVQTINVHNSDLPTLQAKISFLTVEQTALEGDVASVTISLDKAADGFIYAPYEISGSASFGSDHNLRSGTILFFPGQKTAVFSVDLFVDQETEQAEDIIIKLKSPLGNVTFGNIITHTIHLLTETSPTEMGSVSGITFKDNVGAFTNVSLELKFTGTNETFNTNSDSLGKFSFDQLPASGDFIINSQTVDNFRAKGTGSITQGHLTQEVAMVYKKIGAGKFSGTAVMNDNQSIVVPNASMVIRSFDDTYEAFTVTDSEGKFSFEDLPLLGRFYIALFHEDGRFRNSSFVITPAQPEVTNINYVIFTLPGFPNLANAAFPYGGFESWFGVGNSVVTPQSDAFGAYTKKGFFTSPTTPEPIPYQTGQEWYEEEYRLPPRTHLKTKFQRPSQLIIDKNLPCENRNFAAVLTTSQVSSGVGQGILEQYITIEDDADTLIGRVKFLTNETAEYAQMGYNDTFTVLFSNPTRSIFLKQGDVKNLTWGPGVLGFQYATQEFDIAVDVRHLRGKKAKLSFLVFDRGDNEGVSGIALSNFQILKSVERNFVESGSWTGDTTYTKNIGEVSWFSVTNPNSMTTLKITDSLILAKNQTVTIPTVKFGNEPLSRSFNIDTLNSSDIFNYTLESSWITSMPTSACPGGRK